MSYTRSIILITMVLLLLQGCSTQKECQQLIESKCVSCHSIQKSCEQLGKSKQYWESTVDHMIRLNVSISDSEKKKLVRCLRNSSKNLRELCE